MRVSSAYDPARARIDVYVRVDPESALVYEDGLDRVVRIAAGYECPIYLSVPSDMAGLLISALQESGAAEPATQAHLRDAVVVRDRLLAMVESRWNR